ncbi:hypothetical protein [Thalassococcus sp. S3]|uniref:hypothetical protein n=1 Tax=Thalassococcus sp. S3 TaxID=2017482 RepID=UPI00102C1880|nr:hypothetical protein [Thalassococcus sp. S3]
MTDLAVAPPPNKLEDLLAHRTAHTIETLLALIAPGPNDLVVWSGSLLEGFGNETSDIDVYVIADDITHRPGVRSPFFDGADIVSANVVGKTRIDVNYMPSNAVNGAILALNSFDEFDDSRTKFDTEVLEFLHRMSFAVPLNVDEVPQRLRPSKAALSNYISATKLDNANSYKADSIGAARKGDLHTAILCERLRIRSLVDVLLAKNSETNTRFEKWRFAKLHRCGETQVYHDLAISEGITCCGRQDSALEDYLATIRAFATSLEDRVI